jgi:hypothetical protein
MTLSSVPGRDPGNGIVEMEIPHGGKHLWEDHEIEDVPAMFDYHGKFRDRSLPSGYAT